MPQSASCHLFWLLSGGSGCSSTMTWWVANCIGWFLVSQHVSCWDRLHGGVGQLFLYRNPRHNQSYWILGIWSFTAVSMFTCLPTCLFWKCPYTGISSTDVSHVRSSPSAWTLAHYTTTEGPTSEREPTVGPWHAQREHGQLELLSVGAASSRVLMQAYTNWWRPQLADQGGDQLLITGRTSHQCWHVVLQASHCTLRKGGSHTGIR